MFLAPRVQDRKILAFGSGLGAVGLVVFAALLGSGEHASHSSVSYGSLFACWWAIALGFNMASTVTVSLLSKQLPPEWNKWTSLAIQYANYTGRVTGAVWGTWRHSLNAWMMLITCRRLGCFGGYAELRRSRAGHCGAGRAVLRWTVEGLEGEERIEIIVSK